MLTLTQPPHELLIQKLSRRGPLSEADRQAIRDLPMTIRTLAAQKTIVHEDDPSPACCLVLEGWICCYQMLDEGMRAILSVHVPGDLPDLQSLHLPNTEFGMGTLTEVTIGIVPHEAVRKLMAASPAIADALWKEMLVMGAIHRAWMAGLGRREARARLAHLFCELSTRLRAVGLVHDDAFAMPLRQTELADMVGLTSVHVNRTLGDLRKQGLIRLDGRRLKICRWHSLSEAAGFDPKYLHLPDDVELAAMGSEPVGLSSPTDENP